mgnify:CR=1 FL=1
MPFAAEEFRKFANEWGFESDTSSPRYPQSNGLAEKAVSIAKGLLQKNTDVSAALLQYRNAPIPGLQYSLAQLIASRTLRSNVIISQNQLQPAVPDAQVVDQFKRQRLEMQTLHYNKTASRERRELNEGDEVYVRRELTDARSEPARVVKTQDRQAEVELSKSGGRLLRNRRFIQQPARYRDLKCKL